ncbi:tubulin polyglutamylase TTLL4 isoform X1 [Osmerus eperlanus]|uniref:tubulin polyglutamylase TTLL4 isoform X1 n=1 Tax=Osmerus eperlanus TaxID=29151 RepID=UPI002E0DFDDC
MASSEAEDLNEKTSQPVFTVRVKSAANPHVPFDPVEKKQTHFQSQLCSSVHCKHVAQPNELSVDTDSPYCASETHVCSKRAYRSVPAATLIANHAERHFSACATCANVLSNGHTQPGVPVSKNTQQPTVQNNPRPNWNLDLFKLRSGLLGKRAFSPQPAASGAYLTCPCPSKTSSPGAPVPFQAAQSSMPTNQSSPWGSVSLKDHGKAATTKPTSTTTTRVKVPSRPSHGPRQGTKNPTKPVPPQLTQSFCQGGDTGDGKTRFTMPLQAQTVSQDVSMDHLWRLNDTLKFENGVTADMEGVKEHALVCTSNGGEGRPTGGIHKVTSEVVFTEAVRKLTQSTVSHARNKSVVNGRAVNGEKSAHAKATNLSPSCHSIPAKPSPLCLTSTAQQASSVEPMETWEISTTGTCASPALNPEVPTTQASASPSVTQERSDDAVLGSPPTPSVGSVTTQISAIHLTREGCPSKSPSPSPPLEEGLPTECDASGLESVAMLQDEDGEFQDVLEGDSSDEDGSDCSSMNDSSSTASMSALSNIEEPMSSEVEDEREEKPALVPSMFPHIPPTLYFSTDNERVELLPLEQRHLLKWKMSSVTPNVVKNTITRSNFKVTKRSHDWLGCWGHHMKSPCFKAIREYQKLNHFPGSFQIGRKDRLWRNLSKMQARFGKRDFGFFPRSFVLPQDIKQLKKAWEDGSSRQKWIIKPPASARGIGIQVIHKWSQMPRKRPLLVQKYLHKPYLISGNKFDLRIYVYVSSYDPLRIYIFSDGLVRFASCKYSSSTKSLGNKFMHLTNYSVNKKNSEYQSNSDNTACQGHKWALKALWQYLGSKGVNTTVIWEKIKDIVIKTIIASDPYVNSLVKMHLRSPYSCHELFGFDIMLDENLKPWVLEVNISPSLHSNTALDVAIKGQMIRDVLNLAGFVLPQRDDVVPSCSSASSSTSSVCGGTRERSRSDLSTDEKVKRAFYLSQRFTDQALLSSVLDVLTPDDVRVLAHTEDELCRKGDFERIFPSPTSSRYLRFFEHSRYLNILLDQWGQKYSQNESKGIHLLKTLCQKGVHLGTSDPAHIWSKSSYVPRQELSRSSVVVSHSRRFPPDDDDFSDREIQSVTSSLPDISLMDSPGLSRSSSPGLSRSSSSSPSPGPIFTQSLPPKDFI